MSLLEDFVAVHDRVVGHLQNQQDFNKTLMEQRDKAQQENADLRYRLVHDVEDAGSQISQLKASLDKAQEALKAESESHFEQENGLRKVLDEAHNEVHEFARDRGCPPQAEPLSWIKNEFDKLQKLADYREQESKKYLDAANQLRDNLKAESEDHIERERVLRKTADELRDELKELREDVKKALPTAPIDERVPLMAALAGFNSVEEALNAKFQEGWDAALYDMRVVVKGDNKVLANDLVEVEEFTLLPYEDRYRVEFKDGRVLFGLKHLAAHYISLGLILKRRTLDDPEEQMARELGEELEGLSKGDGGRIDYLKIAKRAMKWAREQ